MPSIAVLLASARTLLSVGIHDLRHRHKDQLPALDALRSFAILLVVAAHWGLPEYGRAGGAPSRLQGHPLVWYGWTGVDLFFVLSGYLIGRQLWRELQRTGTVRIGRFLIRRGLRIWPLYFVLLAYYAIFSPDIHPRWSDWTFLSNYVGAGMGRSWTLSTEEQFYIFVPVLLWLLRKRLTLARFAWVLLAVEAAVLLVRELTIGRLLASGRSLVEGVDYVLVYPFHTHLEGLLIGLAIALLSVVRPQLFERRSAGGVSWVGLGAMTGAIALAAALRIADHKLFSHLSLGLIFGGCAFWALGDRSWMTRPLRAWIFYPISRLSYGMYLNHFWVAPSLNTTTVDVVQRWTGNADAVFAITMLVGILVSIVIALVTFLLIEHPFLVLRDKWLRYTSAAAQTPESATPIALPA